MSRNGLVMSAVLAAFGCADANGGASPPPFSSENWPTTGAQNGSQPDDTTNTPAAQGSNEGTSSGAANVTGSNGSGNQPANEGQSANLSKDPASNGANTGGNSANNAGSNTGNGGNAAPAGSNGSNGMTAGTNQGGNGMQGGMQGGMQAGNGMQGGNGMQNNAPAPPPPPAALDCSAPPPMPSGGTQSCKVNASGSEDGQNWFLWFGGSGGCITTYDNNAAFTATWNNSGDFLARMGLQFDQTKTFDQYGTIGADLAFSKSGTGGNYSFIGIYGWSNNPLVEYYIVENSFQNGVTTPYGTTQKGQFTVDGATYKIYTDTKTNQPSILGNNATFQQIYSVRQTPRTCGHVSISEHFKQWASMGLNLGKMYEARVLVEAGGGSGSATFTRAYVSTGN